MPTKRSLILVGGGGHCKSVIEVAESAGYTILGILDCPEKVGEKVLDYSVIGTDDDIPKYADKASFLVTVGQIKTPNLRIKLHQMIEETHGCLATVISPFAHVSKYAIIGKGTVIMHQAVVNAGARIGKGCIINTFANVEHDVTIGDYCHISTGAMINGDCRLADGVFVGSQSVVNQGISIGSCVIIGSLSVANESITKEGIYAGAPAKIIK